VNAGVVAMHHFQSKRSQQGICTAWAKGVDKIVVIHNFTTGYPICCPEKRVSGRSLTNTMKKGADQNENSGFDTD
jgi:hypothetical protein